MSTVCLKHCCSQSSPCHVYRVTCRHRLVPLFRSAKTCRLTCHCKPRVLDGGPRQAQGLLGDLLAPPAAGQEIRRLRLRGDSQRGQPLLRHARGWHGRPQQASAMHAAV